MDEDAIERLTLSQKDKEDRKNAIIKRLSSFADKNNELKFGVFQIVADEFDVNRTTVSRTWKRALAARAEEEKVTPKRNMGLSEEVPEKRAILRHLHSIAKNNELQPGDVKETAYNFNVPRTTVTKLWKKATETQETKVPNKCASPKQRSPAISSPLQGELDLPSPLPPPMLEDDWYHQDHGNEDADTHTHNYDVDKDALVDKNHVPHASSNDRESGVEQQGALSPIKLSSFSVSKDNVGDGGDGGNAVRETRKRRRKEGSNDEESLGFMSDSQDDEGDETQRKEDSIEEDSDDSYEKMLESKRKQIRAQRLLKEKLRLQEKEKLKQQQKQKSRITEFPLSLLPPRSGKKEKDNRNEEAGQAYIDEETLREPFTAPIAQSRREPFAAPIARSRRESFAAPIAQNRREQSQRKLFQAPVAPVMRKAAEVYLANDPTADSGDYGLEFLYATQSKMLPQSSIATSATFPRPDLFPPPSNCTVPTRLIEALQNPFLASRTVGSLVKWKFYSADYALSIAFLEKGGCKHLVAAMNNCLDIGTVKLKKIMQSNFTNNKQGILDKTDEGGAPFLANCLTLLTDILEASHHANSATKALTHFQYAGACDAVCRVLLYHIKFIAQKNKMFEDERMPTGTDETDAENDKGATENKDVFVLNEKLVYRACCAIGHFAYPKLFEQHIVECHGVNALLGALEAFPKRLKIQGAVCLALYNLANQSAPDSMTRASLIQHLERGAVLDFVTKRVMDVLDIVNGNKLYAARSEKYIKDQVLKAGPVVLTFVDKVKDCLLNDQGRSSSGQKEQKNMWLVVKRGENNEEDLY